MTDKKLQQVRDALYASVLNPEDWRKALGLCGTYTGGLDAQISTFDKQRLIPIAGAMAGTNFEAIAISDYARHYCALDPVPKMASGLSLHDWQCSQQQFDQAYVDRSEFYQDFLMPHQLRYGLFVKVDEDASSFTMFASMRALGQQPFGVKHQQAGHRISTDLQRVVQLQRHTQALRMQAEFGAKALDALAFALWVVDGTGRIRYGNRQAETLLGDATVDFVTRSGLLTCRSSPYKERLAALIVNATRFPAIAGGMLLKDAREHKVLVVPLPACSRLNHDWQIPLALVLGLQANSHLSSLQLMSTLYDFSPAEVRLAAAMLTGHSLERYASDVQLTLNTVRTQLKSLFHKTGTSRQAELVALLSQCPPLSW